MNIVIKRSDPAIKTVDPSRNRSSLKRLYHDLFSKPCISSDTKAYDFLAGVLTRLPDEENALPDSPTMLTEWLLTQHHAVSNDYSEYINQRRQNQPRRYFPFRSSALDYIEKISPTKLVDGAWLYGVLEHWQDLRFRPLIDTYLDELGMGAESLNHVVIYRKLLSNLELEAPADLDDNFYLQGTIQLALGRQLKHFIPELLGYNLGYEQPPLHLFITAYELAELGIDPHYFRLHTTIDNADNGHAFKAVKAIKMLLPNSRNQAEVFYKRVKRGYMLNQLGPSVTETLESFNLQAKLVSLLERKAEFGQNLHSDQCSIGGLTINEWLSRKGKMHDFLLTLQEKSWVKRNQDPSNSRFWKLINGPGAKMFGVFSASEQQLIYDWIAGDWLKSKHATTLFNPIPMTPIEEAYPSPKNDISEENSILNMQKHAEKKVGIDEDSATLMQDIAKQTHEKKMQLLISNMSPSMHCYPTGLLATRLFAANL